MDINARISALEETLESLRNEAGQRPVSFNTKAEFVLALASGRVFEDSWGRVLCFEEHERDPFRSLRGSSYMGNPVYLWSRYTALNEIENTSNPWYLNLPSTKGILCRVWDSNSRTEGKEVVVTHYDKGCRFPFRSFPTGSWTFAEPVRSTVK